MPKSYTSSQRTAIQQFTAFTNASDRTAAKWLKQNSWNVEVAADSFFHSNGRSGGSGSTHSSGNVSRSAITKVFDQYRESSDPPDQMTINGVMGYFQAIDINLEDPVLIAICEKLQSPTMGEFSRNGFVDGWVNLGCDTVAKMKDKVPELRQSMANDPAYFKSVYLWTFNWARSEGQKSLPLENAIEWWRLLLQNRFSGHLDHWITFLTEKWNKSVPKDTWNMLYDFVEFAEKDPSLASYDEMGAWPSVIDGYVEYYRDMNK